MSLSLKKFLICFLLFVVVLFLPSCTKKVTYKFPNKDISIALVLPGPVKDSLWNEAAYNGLKRFQIDYKDKVKIAVVEKVDAKDARDIFLKLGEKKVNLIIGYSYKYEKVLKKIVQMFPESFFCLVGKDLSEEPNVCSFNFKHEQYGYLIGIIAGINTSTNKIGIVVSRKIPWIEKVILGMRKGLRSINPKADLVVSYINTNEDIAKGREAGVSQINSGVDVITHIADYAGIGVIKAAEDADISAIGSVIDQHDLAPSTVITSGLLDASQLIYLICENYIEKTLEPKAYYYGLKDQLIETAPSYGNIDPNIETKINRIKSKLIDLEAAQSS